MHVRFWLCLMCYIDTCKRRVVFTHHRHYHLIQLILNKFWYLDGTINCRFCQYQSYCIAKIMNTSKTVLRLLLKYQTFLIHDVWHMMKVLYTKKLPHVSDDLITNKNKVFVCNQKLSKKVFSLSLHVYA